MSHLKPARLIALAAMAACTFAAATVAAEPPAPPPPDTSTQSASDSTPPVPDKPDDTTESGEEPTSSPDASAGAAAAVAAREGEQIGKLRYTLGGLVGTFYGLGIGHAIVGEYTSTGWFYTVTELATAGVMIYGIHRSLDEDEMRTRTPILLVGTSIAFLALRIAEAHDVWTRPEVASVDTPSDTAFAIGPVSDRGHWGALFRWRW